MVFEPSSPVVVIVIVGVADTTVPLSAAAVNVLLPSALTSGRNDTSSALLPKPGAAVVGPKTTSIEHESPGLSVEPQVVVVMLKNVELKPSMDRLMFVAASLPMLVTVMVCAALTSTPSLLIVPN